MASARSANDADRASSSGCVRPVCRSISRPAWTRARSRSGSRELRRRGRGRARRGAVRAGAGRPRARARAHRRRPRRPRLSSTCPSSPYPATRPVTRGWAPSPTRSRPSSRQRSTTSPPAIALLLQDLSRGFDARLPEAKERESAVDFEDLQLLARDAPARSRARARAGALSLPVDHGRRVPGHEPAAVRAHRPARPATSSSSSATSSSRSTGSATPTSTCSASGARRAAACSR